jgi:hypothetical protein
MTTIVSPSIGTETTCSAELNASNRSFPRQFLVRFQSETHVISLDDVDIHSHNDGIDNVLGTHTANRLLELIADRTGWPRTCLLISHYGFPFVQVQARSSIRGGKGGFGTLLKGQSRQAGAKMTTDFGACRDLQGRRLRHVNDEIKLRKWRERQRREAAGEKVDTDAMWNTPSGLYNWHLMTPTWADISKKDTNRIKRQFQKMDRKLEKEVAMKREKDEAYQKTMTHYLDETNSVSASVQQNLSDAIRQGLSKNNNKSKSADAAAKNKRKRTDASTEDVSIYSPDGDEQPNSLVSLTGDVVVEQTPGTDAVKIQSKSEFMTAVYVLEREGEGESSSPGSYYYEVTLVTGGLAQIGWASLMDSSNGKDSRNSSGFEPSNDLGDGVGDDACSFAVDGSRGLKFHGGEDWKFPIQWSAGDRLGCRLNTTKSNKNESGSSSMSFTLNGKDMGVAFTNCGSRPMVPAFSCNQNEILELHLTKKDCKYFPAAGDQDIVAVKSLASLEPSRTQDQDSSKSDDNEPTEKKSTNIVSTSKGIKTDDTSKLSTSTNDASVVTEKVQEPTKPELLKLDQYKSVQQLEALGLDRLKSALLALKVKCGGTLQQRAERLFSLKGLEYKDFPKKVRAKGFVEK